MRDLRAQKERVRGGGISGRMRPDRLSPSPGSYFLDLVEGGQLPDQWHYRGGYQSWSLNCQRGGVSALISSMSVRLYRRVAGHELVGSRARDRRTCPWSCCDIAHSLAPKENLRAPHGMMRVIRELLSAACRRYRGSRATIRMRAMVIAQRAARWARSELPSAWLFAAQGEFLLSHNARKYLNLENYAAMASCSENFCAKLTNTFVAESTHLLTTPF